MFLINFDTREIYYVEQRLVKLTGEFEGISLCIQETISPFVSVENVFVNTMLCCKPFNIDQDTIIVDMHREKILIIDRRVVNQVGGIEKVLKIYFSFAKNQQIEVSYVQAFGELCFSYERVEITTELQLIQHALIVKDIGVKDGFYKAYCYFPYALGTYEDNQGFIKNLCKGVSRSKVIAREKALSEAVERLSASLYSGLGEQFQMDVTESLVEPYMHISTYQGFKNIVFWEQVIALSEGGKKYCPLDVLYYPYVYRFPCISNSNGMATHITYENALKAALFELIERDAYLIAWLLKAGIYKINISTLDEALYKKIYMIEQRENLRFYIFIIKIDNPIPVCLMIVEKDGKNLVVLGAGESLILAVYKTFEEAIGSIEFFDRQDMDKEDLTLQHIFYYLQNINADKIERLKKLPYYSYQGLDKEFYGYTNVAELSNYYQKLNINLYVYDYKNRVNDAFKRYTVRVLSDQLIPIYFGKGIPPQVFHSSRLKYWKDKFKVKDINLDLHPMG